MNILNSSKEEKDYLFGDKIVFWFDSMSGSKINYFTIFSALPKEFSTNFDLVRKIVHFLGLDNIYHIFDIYNGAGLLNNSDFFLLSLMMPDDDQFCDYKNWNNLVINLKVLNLDDSPNALLSNPKFLIDACCILGSILNASSLIDDIMKKRTPELYLEFESIKKHITELIEKIYSYRHSKSKVESLEAELVEIVSTNGRAFEYCDYYRKSDKLVIAASKCSIWCAAAFFRFGSIGYDFSYLNDDILMNLASSDWRVGMWLNQYDRRNFKLMSKMIRFSPKIYNFESIVRKTYSSLARFNSIPKPLLLLVISFTY